MPVDKAISWPLSQENSKALLAKALRTLVGDVSMPISAPLEGKAVDLALFLRIQCWSKNDQFGASHAGHEVATAMNGLSTGCSTVFVRKRKARA
jgi:hypothetical protein